MSDVIDLEELKNLDETFSNTQWKPRFESPWHHVELNNVLHAQRQPLDQPSVIIQEQKGMSQLVLRGNATDSTFVNGVEAALGLSLPLVAGMTSEFEDLRVYWQSPDEWLIVGKPDQARNIETALRNTLSGHFAITDVTGGQTLVSLSGANAENVLKKSISYDVNIKHFPIGKIVGTAFAKSQIQLRRTGEQSFELILRRSFADYLWSWLVDAGQEYGVALKR
ncbi:sarcosine oxidase subunit gamma [Vibrio paucivorans]